MLHDRNPSGIVFLVGRIVHYLPCLDVKIVCDEPLDIDPLLRTLDRRYERKLGIVLSAIPQVKSVTLCQTVHKLKKFIYACNVL